MRKATGPRSGGKHYSRRTTNLDWESRGRPGKKGMERNRRHGGTRTRGNVEGHGLAEISEPTPRKPGGWDELKRGSHQSHRKDRGSCGGEGRGGRFKRHPERGEGTSASGKHSCRHPKDLKVGENAEGGPTEEGKKSSRRTKEALTGNGRTKPNQGGRKEKKKIQWGFSGREKAGPNHRPRISCQPARPLGHPRRGNSCGTGRGGDPNNWTVRAHGHLWNSEYIGKGGGPRQGLRDT